MTAEERAELEAAEAERRRRAAELPADERERLRARAAELGRSETIEATLKRLRENPPPGPPEADDDEDLQEDAHRALIARAAWRSPIITDDRPRIMPRSIAQVEEDAEHYYLARFPRAAHRDQAGQLSLGFAHEDEGGPTLPANIWTMGLADAEKRGAVVPLALRLFVACVLHTPLAARRGDQPIALTDPADPLTLRKFIRWGYDGLWTPGRDWGRLQAACDAINDARIVYEAEGNLWERRPVTIDKPMLYSRELLNAVWPVIVHFPPGDGIGPPVDFARLQRWARKRGGNAAAYRALINLAYRWWIQGKRLHPASRQRGAHWLRHRDPKVYDRLSDRDRDLLCFPPGTGKTDFSKRVRDADAALELLVREGDAVVVDGRLLPPT